MSTYDLPPAITAAIERVFDASMRKIQQSQPGDTFTLVITLPRPLEEDAPEGNIAPLMRAVAERYGWGVGYTSGTSVMTLTKTNFDAERDVPVLDEPYPIEEQIRDALDDLVTLKMIEMEGSPMLSLSDRLALLAIVAQIVAEILRAAQGG